MGLIKAAVKEKGLGLSLLGEDGVEVVTPEHDRGVLVSHWLQNYWFRGGLVFKAHRLCVSLNPRLESDKAEEKDRSQP
jgi:hypothetical protein